MKRETNTITNVGKHMTYGDGSYAGVQCSWHYVPFLGGQLYLLSLYDSCVALWNLQIHINILLGR